MSEKICNGYESMFTFLNEEDFQKHLDECESCKAEHEKMNRVSELIAEAKPYFKKKKEKLNALKAACAVTVLFITGGLGIVTTGLHNDLVAYNTPTIEEMGLPVDEYGLLIADHGF